MEEGDKLEVERSLIYRKNYILFVLYNKFLFDSTGKECLLLCLTWSWCQFKVLRTAKVLHPHCLQKVNFAVVGLTEE